MNSSKENIVKYYNDAEIDYKILWNLRKSKAMHYSFRDSHARTFKQGLLRTNDKVIELCNINPKSKVLDAGCGVGGSSVYIAQKTNCDMTGITIVDSQTKKATRFAKDCSVNVKFFTKDYTKTNFPSNSFDVIFAVESVCHAKSKKAFLKESFRLLKSGGRLVIFDFFQSCNISELSIKEKAILSKWAGCWAIDSYEIPINMINNASSIGFDNINYENVTKNILGASKKLNFWFFPAVPVDFIGRLFMVRNNTTRGNVYSARYQYKALKKHLWEYGIFYAEKNDKHKI